MRAGCGGLEIFATPTIAPGVRQKKKMPHILVSTFRCIASNMLFTRQLPEVPEVSPEVPQEVLRRRRATAVPEVCHKRCLRPHALVAVRAVPEVSQEVLKASCSSSVL